jgi:hypothetical protein
MLDLKIPFSAFPGDRRGRTFCAGHVARKGQEKVKRQDQEYQESSAPAGASPKRRVSRLTILVIVVILIVAAFGAGAFLINTQFQAAQAAWREEKAALESKIAAQLTELSTVRSRDLLWRLSESMSLVYIDVSEKNFGLARDQLDALNAMLARASADLDAATKAQLAPLPPLIQEISRNVSTLSPEAKSKAREAMSLLRKMIGTNGS